MRKYIFLLVLYLILSIPAFSQIMFTASMDGAQETPPTMTSATGTAWLVLSPDFKSISFSVTYARLSAPFTNAHFHVAPVGIAGNPVFPLDLVFVGNTAKGTWSNIPDSILAKLFNGQLYVNVHSTNNPSGEIRGQFKAVDGIGFTSSADGNQEIPSVPTTATGTGFAVIEKNAQQIHYQFTIAGLSSNFTVSHFHLNAVGVNGNPVEPISFGSDSTVAADWSAPADSVLTAFLNGDIYFNAHSTNFPAGEIRGQMIHQGEIMLTANLTGDQEVPPVTTTAKGTGFVVIKNDNKSVFYRETFANLSSSLTLGHIHMAATGVNGSPIIPFVFTGNSTQGTATVLPDTVLAFIKGNTYMNVHSSKNPGGEIRGQLNTVTGIGFTGIIDGAQETPPLAVPGNGTGFFVWDDTKAELDFQVTIAGLTSNYTVSHFHDGAPGVGGTPVHQFSLGTDSTVAAVWTGLADSNIIELNQGNLYTNYHTSNNPGGEIRGQVLFSNVYSGNVTGINDPEVTVPLKFNLQQNYPNPFNPTTIISFTLSERSRITLKVYDILGRVVDVLTDGFKEAGNYKVNFNGRKLASGMYIYSLSSDKGDFVSKKMMLIK
jgi:hypothetical protein